MRRPCCIIVLILLAALPAQAARLAVSTGEPVEVRILPGRPTVVTFPEGIRAIPTSADPAAVSLEIEGERLFIQSLQDGFGALLFVVGDSGALHLLQLVQHDEPDTEVQLVLPQVKRPFGEAPPSSGGRRRMRDSPMRRLLVALLKGEALPGVKVVAHDQVLAASPEVEIRTTHLYAAGRYLGFIGVAENRTPGPLVLRLPEYQAPGLKAIAADSETLAPGGATRVVLVVEPGSPY